MQFPALCGRTLLSTDSAWRRLLTRSPRSSLHLLIPNSSSALRNLPPRGDTRLRCRPVTLLLPHRQAPMCRSLDSTHD